MKLTLDFAPKLTSQVTDRIVSLSIAFLTINIKFQYCKYEVIIVMLSIHKSCFRKQSLVTFSFIRAEFADFRVNFVCEQEVLPLSLSVTKTRDQDFQFCVFLCIRDFPFCELTFADRRKIPILLVSAFCEF